MKRVRRRRDYDGPGTWLCPAVFRLEALAGGSGSSIRDFVAIVCRLTSIVRLLLAISAPDALDGGGVP